MGKHAFSHRPEPGLHTNVPEQQIDADVHYVKSGTHAAASLAATSCVVPPSVGDGLTGEHDAEHEPRVAAKRVRKSVRINETLPQTVELVLHDRDGVVGVNARRSHRER